MPERFSLSEQYIASEIVAAFDEASLVPGPARMKLRAAPALLVLAATSATAQITTTQGTSILIFPRVVATAQRDSLLQITNLSNNMVHARCFYIDGDTCARTDFQITLTRQQPTQWVVSAGRPAVAGAQCSSSISDCPAAGLPPGYAGSDPDTGEPIPAAIPAPNTPFSGELLCVQIDASGVPFGGNSLVGRSELVDQGSGDVASYNAVGIPANSDLFGQNPGVLTLSANGGDANACPDTWVLNHLAEAVPDSLIGPGSAIRTELSIIPCTQNLIATAPQANTLQLQIVNEFEQTLSVTPSVSSCGLSLSLADPALLGLFDIAALGSQSARTSIRTDQTGVLIVGEERHQTPGTGPAVSAAAVNLHTSGVRGTDDVITLPQP
jgi:hypothetical protein